MRWRSATAASRRAVSLVRGGLQSLTRHWIAENISEAIHTPRATAGGRRTSSSGARSTAFPVATAVVGDHVTFTNSAWSFSQRAVREALGLQRLVVVNDFEALALSLPDLQPSQLLQQAGPPLAGVPTQIVAVVGPGTGLGVAGLAFRPPAVGSPSRAREATSRSPARTRWRRRWWRCYGVPTPTSRQNGCSSGWGFLACMRP